jgi:hypothetical protein
VNSVGTSYGNDKSFTTSACEPTANAPSANTDSATNITADSAKLYGTVIPNGAETNVTFDFGTNTSYGQNLTATPSSIDATADATTVTANINGLECATNYHYRVKATNSEGTTYGNDKSFITATCNSTNNANLESPQQGSFESGIGLIRGWVCHANTIEIQIDGGNKRQVAYGTARGDTQSTCGHANTGFGFTYNWNVLSNGTHNLKAFADNVQFADVNFTTTNLGTSYLTGANGQYTLANFPTTGKSATLKWSEPHQNFVISNATRSSPRLGSPQTRNGIIGNLESPTEGSYESGVALIRGWMCQADKIEIQIDGGTKRQVAYGTARGDTASQCNGNPNTGFGFVYNWNGLGDGNHNLRLLVDDQEFTNVTFTVTTLGGNYLTGLSRDEVLPNFPQSGKNVKVRWAEPHQNFVIVDTPNSDCTYSISPTNANFLANGGTFNVNVYTENGCNWTATTNNTNWIAIVQGNSGSGNGTVKLSVTSNTSSNSRAATLTIAGKTFTAQQEGASNNQSNLTPYKPDGWSDKIVVSNSTGSTTDSNSLKSTDTIYVDWAVLNNGNADSGSYVVDLYVDGIKKYSWDCSSVPNNYCYLVDFEIGSLSAGTHTIRIVADSNEKVNESNESDNTYEKNITVLNDTPTCNYSISPTSQSFAATGGTNSVSVSTSNSCNWTAVSNANWISITSGANGTGNGTVKYSVTNNSSSSSRSATLTIATKTFTVTQAGSVSGSGEPKFVIESIYVATFDSSRICPDSDFDVEVKVKNEGTVGGDAGRLRVHTVARTSYYNVGWINAGQDRDMVVTATASSSSGHARVTASIGISSNSTSYYVLDENDRYCR